MTTPLLSNPIFFDSRAPSGLLYTYVANTTTPQVTYSDAAGITPNTNPVQLDTTGAAIVRLGAGLAYDFVLKDQSNTTTIDSINNYTQPLYLTSITQALIVGLLYPQTTAEVSGGVTPVNLAYLPAVIDRYATNTTPGTTDMAQAVRNALSANGYVLFGVGPYLIGSTIVLTGNESIIGLTSGGGKSSQLTQIVHSTGSTGALFSATSNEFGGIYIGHLDISGGNGSYAIVSARPQSMFEFIHLEGASGYNGSGIQLQSGSNGATAPGSWECTIRDCKWVAPATTTAYRGYDLTINGGAVNVERCIATRGSIGFCLNQGATVRFIACDSSFQNLTYSSESISVGQAAFKFKTSAGAYHNSCEISGCYVEVSTAGVWIDECTSLKISNTLTNDAATFGSGGLGVYLAAAAQNVTVSNCNITLNYNGEIGIDNLGANTVLENNMILALSSATGTAAYRTITAMTVRNSLPLATSAAPTGYIFAGAPIDANHLICDLTGDPRTFTGTLTGCTTAPTVTITYVVSGRAVTLNIPALSATSNTTACSITGVPNSIIPATGTYVMQCTGLDNTASVTLSATTAAGSAAINLSKLGGAAFTNSGTKGINASTITYLLA